MSVLGTEAIKRAIADRHIIIDPYLEELVSVNSIDVRLGPEMYMLQGQPSGMYEKHGRINDVHAPPEERYVELDELNIWGSTDTDDIFGIEENIYTPSPVCPRGEFVKGWVLESGFYLGSTLEAIGTSADSGLIPDMNSKSTMGRNGLTVARCAGRGDVGYAARWTLGIHVTVPTLICVGTIIGQVRFTRCEGVGDSYGGASSYQPGGEMKMLPKPMKILL